MQKILTIVLILFCSIIYSQRPQGQQLNPIQITGTVIDSDDGLPLEYATLVLQSIQNPDKVTGGITDMNGKFNVETLPGKYNIRVEYISYKTYELPNQTLKESTDLGTIKLALDVAQLKEVEVVGERTTVELRLDKKVYNVGSDLTVKGGSVTDVLDNVPSVSVDVDGAISLRGNESVRILINGKPSALSGLSSEALQQLPAESIEKVEVITNPSARYDAEGTAGILNIVLKQSKTTGLNGSLGVNVGHPDQYGANVNLNLRRDKFNIFTNTSYRYRTGPGNAIFEQEYFDENGNTSSFQDEYREFLREDAGFNTNIGIELFIDSTSSITNSFVYRKSNGENTTDIDFDNFDALRSPTISRYRGTVEDETDENIQYSLNYTKNFNDDGHKITADYQYSSGKEIEISTINEHIIGDTTAFPTEQSINDEKQNNQLLQVDYVRPFGKENNSQFEMGYRGNFNEFNTDFDFGILENNVLNSNPDYSNELVYTENINALYTQLGTKIDKFNILGGLRMENSAIGVELINTNDKSTKNYTNWFPSLFLGYEMSEKEQITVSYSKRLRRPRSRYINPFPSRSSNTNLFQGNPDLNPTFTDAYDLGYLKRWDKISFTTSVYFNKSTGVFQFITQENGDFVSIPNPDEPSNPIIVPVQVRTPINLATETRAGGELTTTYTPKRGWRLTWNINVFQQQLRGNYTYTNFQDQEIVQNFDADNLSWFSRLSAKLPLPGEIDFQSNLFYMGPSTNAQGSNKSMLFTSLAFSKEILNKKASLALNVRDVFNSAKRRGETRTDNVFTYSEYQRRQRSINLAFTYRFNQKKNERQRGQRGGGDDDGGGFDEEG